MSDAYVPLSSAPRGAGAPAPGRGGRGGYRGGRGGHAGPRPATTSSSAPVSFGGARASDAAPAHRPHSWAVAATTATTTTVRTDRPATATIAPGASAGAGAAASATAAPSASRPYTSHPAGRGGRHYGHHVPQPEIAASGGVDIHVLPKPKDDTRERTSDVISTQNHDFEEYGLKKELLEGIFEKGFDAPSPVQELVIPQALMRSNILARSKNGTGKTAAFCIPCLQLVDVTKPKVQALILVPTRELALQTSAILKELGKFMEGLGVASVIGGTDVREDLRRLTAVTHIVVGTAGRVLDLVEKNALAVKDITFVALDEADKLLDATFSETVDRLIMSYLPKNRQLLLLSATFPRSVRTLCDRWMPPPHAPKMINLMDELTLVGITQFYAYMDETRKMATLIQLLGELSINQSVIFCNSVGTAEHVASMIRSQGAACFYLHARMSQEERTHIFHGFRTHKFRHLVTTDLVTRGIDVPEVNVVINYDFPGTSETYLHRIGRGGRFGHKSIAISFVTKADEEKLFTVEQELSTELRPIEKAIDTSLYCV